MHLIAAFQIELAYYRLQLELELEERLELCNLS